MSAAISRRDGRRLPAAWLAALAAAGAILAAVPARADLTLAGRGTAASLGMPSAGQETLYLKKLRLRRDLLERGKAYTYLYDLESRQVTLLDHSLRQADVYTMKALAGGAGAEVSAKDMKVEVVPTGRTQALQTWNCREHRLNVSLPAVLGGEPVTLRLAGTLWLAPDAPELAEAGQFLQAADSPDIFLGNPLMARATPAQAAALSEVIRRVAPMGMPCAADAEIRYEGSGRMVELARRFATRLGVSFQKFSTAPIRDDAFLVPAGYRVTRK